MYVYANSFELWLDMLPAAYAWDANMKHDPKVKKRETAQCFRCGDVRKICAGCRICRNCMREWPVVPCCNGRHKCLACGKLGECYLMIRRELDEHMRNISVPDMPPMPWYFCSYKCNLIAMDGFRARLYDIVNDPDFYKLKKAYDEAARLGTSEAYERAAEIGRSL